MAGDGHMEGDISDFAREMKKLVNSKDHSDIRFVIGPNRKNIYAHKCILAARCPVFGAMFADQSQKNGSPEKDVPFVLSDMSPDVFLSVLEFIYTNCVTLKKDSAIDVLATALEYGLDELRKVCVDYLVKQLTCDNVCEVLQAAVTYSQDNLREQALVYIERNTATVLKSKSFSELGEEALSAILMRDNLDIDEMDIFLAVKEWANVNSVVLSKPLCEVTKSVVKHVRFPLLSPEELAKLEEENKRDKIIPMECFSYAWKFHALKKVEKGCPLTTRRRGTLKRESHSSLDKS
ncbi:BTB/POZ domain-containing protein 19-like [Liolophura sinensis]|uniref:BTB/POZ domain-containing protein 19-like n=1 Tax=Liolophura sinensis TaxID=3198878 RepID=UPI00315980DE